MYIFSHIQFPRNENQCTTTLILWWEGSTFEASFFFNKKKTSFFCGIGKQHRKVKLRLCGHNDQVCGKKPKRDFTSKENVHLRISESVVVEPTLSGSCRERSRMVQLQAFCHQLSIWEKELTICKEKCQIAAETSKEIIRNFPSDKYKYKRYAKTSST